jgi:hypothetical protein
MQRKTITCWESKHPNLGILSNMTVNNTELCEWFLKSKAFLESVNKDIQVRFSPFGRGNIINITTDAVHIKINELPSHDSIRWMAILHFKAHFHKLISAKDLDNLRKQYIKEKEARDQKSRASWEKREKERERMAELFRPLKAWEDLYQQVVKNKINAKIPAPHLEEKDVRLAIQWSPLLRQSLNPEEYNNIGIQEKYAKNWELAVMLSARAAEKATIEFYRKYGYQVNDVAITQITQNIAFKKMFS